MNPIRTTVEQPQNYLSYTVSSSHTLTSYLSTGVRGGLGARGAGAGGIAARCKGHAGSTPTRAASCSHSWIVKIIDHTFHYHSHVIATLRVSVIQGTGWPRSGIRSDQITHLGGMRARVRSPVVLRCAPPKTIPMSRNLIGREVQAPLQSSRTSRKELKTPHLHLFPIFYPKKTDLALTCGGRAG